MTQLANTILRKGRFRFGGRHRVTAGAAALPEGIFPATPDDELADALEADLEPEVVVEEDVLPELPEEAPVGPPMPPQARIIEQAGGIAVIEVICSCGQVIHLQCFVGQGSGPAAQAPARPAAQPAAQPRAGLANPQSAPPVPAAKETADEGDA